MRTSTGRRGFTLIELLIVIGIIGFVAGAVLVAVDPVRRIQSSRDSQRWSEVNAVLNAILKYQNDNLETFEGDPSDAVAQVMTATLTGSSGTFALNINGTVVSQVFTSTLFTTTSLLADEIDDDPTVGPVVDASSTGAEITVTAVVPGTPFTMTDASSGGDASIAVVSQTENSIRPLIDTDPATAQIIVSSVGDVDCDGGGPGDLEPACPDVSGLTVPTVDGVSCVADISTLAPEYLSEIPVDPREGATPTAGSRPIGETNTGYYINRLPSGRLLVGACYGEQETGIRVQR